MSSFNFLNVVFNAPYFKKPIFYIIKKIRLYCQYFRIPKKSICLRYSAYLFHCSMYKITYSDDKYGTLKTTFKKLKDDL